MCPLAIVAFVPHIGIFVAVYHFCSAPASRLPPLLHPAMVYFKVSRRQRRARARTHTRVHCSKRCWPTGCYELYAGRVAKPLGYVCTYIYVLVRAMRLHAYANTRERALYARHSPPRCQSRRNCKPVHPRGPPAIYALTHARAWISNLLRVFAFSPFFSLDRPLRSVSLAALSPPAGFAPKLFMCPANPGYEEDLN